jgi:hypothetical protein
MTMYHTSAGRGEIGEEINDSVDNARGLFHCVLLCVILSPNACNRFRFWLNA